MCARLKAWLCLGSRIWPKCDVTRSQRPNEGPRIVNITEELTPTCAERDFLAIRRSQPVQFHQLVSYPLVFIYLRYSVTPQCDHPSK